MLEVIACSACVMMIPPFSCSIFFSLTPYLRYVNLPFSVLESHRFSIWQGSKRHLSFPYLLPSFSILLRAFIFQAKWLPTSSPFQWNCNSKSWRAYVGPSASNSSGFSKLPIRWAMPLEIHQAQSKKHCTFFTTQPNSIFWVTWLPSCRGSAVLKPWLSPRPGRRSVGRKDWQLQSKCTKKPPVFFWSTLITRPITNQVTIFQSSKLPRNARMFPD